MLRLPAYSSLPRFLHPDILHTSTLFSGPTSAGMLWVVVMNNTSMWVSHPGLVIPHPITHFSGLAGTGCCGTASVCSLGIWEVIVYAKEVSFLALA